MSSLVPVHYPPPSTAQKKILLARAKKIWKDIPLDVVVKGMSRLEDLAARASALAATQRSEVSSDGEEDGYDAEHSEVQPLWSGERAELVVEILYMLSRMFVEAARSGDLKKMQFLIEKGVSPNYQEPGTRATALHYVAAHGFRAGMMLLVSLRGVNFLLKDCEGRYPSELAMNYGYDSAMARLLFRKETLQGRAMGIRNIHAPD